jgi:hypothetical protein
VDAPEAAQQSLASRLRTALAGAGVVSSQPLPEGRNPTRYGNGEGGGGDGGRLSECTSG